MSDNAKHNPSRTDSTDGSERSLEIWDSISQHSGWEEWMKTKQEWDDYKEWLDDQKDDQNWEENQNNEIRNGEDTIPDSKAELEVTIQDIEKVKIGRNKREKTRSRSDSSGSVASRYTIDTNDWKETEKSERPKND